MATFKVINFHLQDTKQDNKVFKRGEVIELTVARATEINKKISQEKGRNVLERVSDKKVVTKPATNVEADKSADVEPDKSADETTEPADPVEEPKEG